jgi:hypothetical protein
MPDAAGPVALQHGWHGNSGTTTSAAPKPTKKPQLVGQGFLRYSINAWGMGYSRLEGIWPVARTPSAPEAAAAVWFGTRLKTSATMRQPATASRRQMRR